MGGRGAYSYSGMNDGTYDSTPLTAYAAASLNSGIAGGTSIDSAVLRFREQLMDQKYEHSACIDDSGYVHALGSVGKEGSTKVAPLSAVAKEKGISTVVHNHPFGGSDGRRYGGPLSAGDLRYLANAYIASGGLVKRMVATSNEGTYSALITKSVSRRQVDNAIARAERKLNNGKRFQSEIAMWREVNKVYTSEFSKIGVRISYKEQAKKSRKLVTQNIGTF